MGNETSTEATKVDNYKFIDSRCVVKFRPNYDWEGEYGFDWFREGDYGELFNNNSRGKTTKTLYTYQKKDGNGNDVDVVDSNGNPVQIEIKSNSDYKEKISSDQKELIGIYGEQMDFVSLNLSVQRTFKNYINNSNKIYIDNNDIFHFEKKNNGKWILKNSNGEVLLYNGIDEEFDYDEATKLMSNSRYNIRLEKSYFNDFGEGELSGVDPDNGHYSFSDNQRNDAGETINADLYAKNNYSPIDIKASLYRDKVYVPSHQLYYVPSINLFYNKGNNTATNSSDSWEYKATVKLLIHAENILSIDFIIEEGTKGINLNPRSIVGEINGDFEHELKISLTSEFANNTKDVSIRAIATLKNDVFSTLLNNDFTKTLAGKINILRHEPKYIIVVIVPIFVDSHVPSNLNNMLEEEKKRLEKFFSQAQIVPTIHTDKRINDQNSQTKIAKLIDAASDYELDRRRRPVRILVNTVTKRNTTFDGQVITSGTSLHVEFEKLFLGEPYDDNIKNAYKVFYILKKGNCAGQTAGFPNDTPKPPKNVIIFEGHWDETPIHELFHRLGLYHSFSNLSSYTFKKHGTSNIMDYARPDGLKRLSSWKWQWDEIRKQIDEDKKQEQEFNIT